MSDIKKAIEALSANGFKTEVFSDMASAKVALLALIAPDETVGLGGSMTIQESGVLDALQTRGQTLYTTMIKADRTPEEISEIRQSALRADWFLSSSNAITCQGELLNIDGHGNRIAGLIYGPKKAVVIAGQNKIAKNFNEGIKRIKTEACGKNARRLNRDTPCAKDDRCHDCNTPDRMCNTVVWTQRPNTWHTEFHVYIIKEDWGF